MPEVTKMPKWFWLLPAVAMTAWWPIGSYWASDDFIAIAYSQDLGNAASDLVGKQYGATDIWAFYRPLVTLSFWFDQTIGGVWPPLSHYSNVVAHGINALLVALIWRRFLGNGPAFGAALLWAIMPGHIGSIAWAVGRVDSHTTVWCLLALFLCLRANERRTLGSQAARWPMVAATALALMTKELAFAVPALCSIVTLAQLSSGPEAANPLLERGRKALQATWPVWALFALYLPFRILVLGKLGGYDASRLPINYNAAAFLTDLQDKITGIGRVIYNEFVPLTWIGAPDHAAQLPAWTFLVAAGLPIAIALVTVVIRRPRMTVITLITFLVAMAPMVTFWSASSPHNLRYYYLPTIALVGLLACTNRWLILAILLGWLWPLIAVRTEQYTADQQSQAMHAAMLQQAPTIPDGPMFVAGLPHINKTLTAIQLHFGVDRMLRPPFYETAIPLYALRPLAEVPGAFRLENPDRSPFAIPEGSTWWFQDKVELTRCAPPSKLPKLEITGDDNGVVDFSTENLLPLIAQYAEIKATGRDSFGLRFPGVKGPFFRLTLFTANGYLCCIFSDHGKAALNYGRLDAVALLTKNDEPGHQYEIARFAPSDTFLGEALTVPTTIDIDPEFPVLIEAGNFEMTTTSFTPTHRANRLLRFRFDRDYPAWVRKVQGK